MSNVWSDVHKNTYAKSDWIDKPSIFAETAVTYFPEKGRVLELGAGQGQDSRFFAAKGYDVVSTDLEQSALDLNNAKISTDLSAKIILQQLDLNDELPFDPASFDVVYAHLSLHYFSSEVTDRIFQEVYRVLKPGGVLAFFTNSTSDPEYGTGIQLEPNYFQIDAMAKRYFSVESTRKFAQYFDVTLLDNHGETYKDSAKGVHNLIRFIGCKPLSQTYKMAIPFAGAIIERDNNGEIELLIQTRWQPGGDSIYTGTLEFPVGKLDVPYENVFKTVAGEIKEETGLTLKKVRGEDKTDEISTDKDDTSFGFRPFCCVQQLKNGKPWIGFIFICSVEPGEPRAQLGETKDTKWVTKTELKEMIAVAPEKFFTLELPAWRYYLKENN